MARLPTAEELGVRTPRSRTQMVDVPDGSAVTRGLQSLAGGVEDFANSQYRIDEEARQKAEQAENYGIATNIDRFKSEQAAKADQTLQQMQPGGAGVYEGFSGAFKKDADAFLATVPERLKPRVNAALQGIGLDYGDRLRGAENKERNRFAGEVLDQDIDRHIGEAGALDDPAAVKSFRDKSAAFIRDNPNLTPVQKDAMLRGLDDRYAKGYADRVATDPRRAKAVFSISPQARATLTGALSSDKDASHVDNLQPRFAEGLSQFIRAAPNEVGGQIGIYSGSRSAGRQAEIIAANINRFVPGSKAAWEADVKSMGPEAAGEKWRPQLRAAGMTREYGMPGASNHQHGKAADLTWNGKRLDAAPKEVQDKVKAVAAKYGLAFPLDNEPWHVEDAGARAGGGGGRGIEVGGSFIDRLIGAESGGDPTAKNARSSATGLGQFTGDTWLATVKTYRPDIARGKSDEQIKALRTDPTLSREMLQRHTDENAKELHSAGYDTTDGNLYLMHFAGKNGGLSILRADDATPVERILSADAISANPFLKGKTAADVKAWAAQKMGTGGNYQPGGDAPRYEPEAARRYYADLFPGASSSTLNSLAEQAVASALKVDRETQVSMRSLLDAAVDNAPAAIQATGQYSGIMPSRDTFAAAYGPVEGAQRADAFETSVETSRQIYGFQTATNEQITAAVAAAQPTSSGDDAALEQRRAEVLSKAAASVLKARAADPAQYVMSTMPGVAAAWSGVQSGTPEYANAMRTTVAAQRALGIPEASIRPLPVEMASTIAARVKDEALGVNERIGAVVSAVFATPDKAQQQAVFAQLVKEGAPEGLAPAMNAYARGDRADGDFLARAALVDPTKLPGKIPNSPTEIDEMIQSELMADGEIGEIAYGLSSGTADNDLVAQRDAPIMRRAVQLRILDGDDLSVAVEKTARSFFGDVKVYKGGWGTNAELLVPKGTDDAELSAGLNESLQKVFRPALEARLEKSMSMLKTDGERNVARQVAQNSIADALDRSIFRSVDGGVGLVSEQTGTFVVGADGKPVTLSIEDAIALSKKPAADKSFGRMLEDIMGSGL